MKKTTLTLTLTLTLILLLSLVTLSHAKFDVQLKNSSDKKLTYIIYWIDHPFRHYGKYIMAGGELFPNNKWIIKSNWPTGTRWVIQWCDSKIQKVIFFKVQPGTARIVIDYEKVISEKGA